MKITARTRVLLRQLYSFSTLFFFIVQKGCKVYKSVEKYHNTEIRGAYFSIIFNLNTGCNNLLCFTMRLFRMLLTNLKDNTELIETI